MGQGDLPENVANAMKAVTSGTQVILIGE